MNSKEFKKARTNKYKRFNRLNSVWDIAMELPKTGSNSNLWNSYAYIYSIKNITKLKISTKVLRKHLPKKYLSLVRLGWESFDSIWVFCVPNSLVANRVSYLLDEISISIAKDIGYAPRIKIAVHPTMWGSKGFSLLEKKEFKNKIPTPEEADKFISKFVNRDD